jgi:hypothetical protein
VSSCCDQRRPFYPLTSFSFFLSVVNSVRFHPSKNIVVTASDDGHCFCYRLPDIAKCDDVESKEQTAKRLLDQGAYLLTLRPAYSLSHSTNRPNVRSNKVLCLNFRYVSQLFMAPLSVLCLTVAPIAQPLWKLCRHWRTRWCWSSLGCLGDVRCEQPGCSR